MFIIGLLHTILSATDAAVALSLSRRLSSSAEAFLLLVNENTRCASIVSSAFLSLFSKTPAFPLSIPCLAHRLWKLSLLMM